MEIKKKILTLKQLFVFTFLISIGVGPVVAQQKSDKTETVHGVTYIIHEIQSKETYYQLSRTYDIAINDLMNANNSKDLRAGDTVRIPKLAKKKAKETDKANGNEVTPKIHATIDNAPAVDPSLKKYVMTDYKVGSKETLYSIAKRFNTSIKDLQILNNLEDERISAGQVLHIPNGPLPEPKKDEAKVPELIIVPSARGNGNISEKDFDENRYGIREKSERGIGVWMENLETKNNSYLALHKTAPVGTILKITNPITKSVTYAKVVGKFTENSETQEAIVVLSKSAAANVGAFDKRFLIQLNYGLPL